jgi:quercetin dioxygenase-like cupin family protein
MSDVWSHLLEAARAAHATNPVLRDFCPFPNDLTPREVTPHHINAARLMEAEQGFTPDALGRAFIAASPQAQWRETYKGTDIGQHFLDRFGCYCLIGAGGAYRSDQMAAYVVYMPPGLHYPWHHHPAEELYFVLAGEARFMRWGAPDEDLRAGDSSFHASNQPHGMETGDHPVLAYVLWRNGFASPPVLNEAGA